MIAVFTGTGLSTEVILLKSQYNVSIINISGGTVQLQRRFNDTDTWGVVKEYTEDAEDILEVGGGPGQPVQHRFECTVYGTGPITYKLV